MRDGSEHGRSMLRAEIRSPKETIVACAREISASGVFVVTDWAPPPDTEVEVCLSLPSVLEPTRLAAKVVGRRAPTGVGELSGIELAFGLDSPGDRERIATALALLAERHSSRPPALRRYRVLLVEDNAFIRDMFAYGMDRFFQQRAGVLELEHVADAASAWERLAASTYDLLIVDYYLPSEDGAALIARLRREPRFASVPVVAMSVGGRDAREATISAGADLFLDKPVVLRDLWGTLELLSARGGVG